MNNKGFIMPLTLTILFIFVSYVTFQINQYMIEKELYFEQTNQYKHERLLQMATVDVKTMVQNGDVISQSGQLFYEDGMVDYVVEDVDHDVLYIQLTSTLQGGQVGKAYSYYYYVSLDQVLPWLEES